MTLPSLVLVCGSRALNGHTDARAWLVAHLDALAPAVIATGDARGPDAWAAAYGREHPAITTRTYRLSGAICTAVLDEPVGWWTRRGEFPPAPDANRAQFAAWCLHRDRRLVEHVARRADAFAVTVLALRSLASTTSGTAYTVARAKAAGLDVVERVWSKQATPGAVPR